MTKVIKQTKRSFFKVIIVMKNVVPNSLKKRSPVKKKRFKKESKLPSLF